LSKFAAANKAAKPAQAASAAASGRFCQHVPETNYISAHFHIRSPFFEHFPTKPLVLFTNMQQR